MLRGGSCGDRLQRPDRNQRNAERKPDALRRPTGEPQSRERARPLAEGHGVELILANAAERKDLRGHGQEMLGVTGNTLDCALEYLDHPVDFGDQSNAAGGGRGFERQDSCHVHDCNEHAGSPDGAFWPPVYARQPRPVRIWPLICYKLLNPAAYL